MNALFFWCAERCQRGSIDAARPRNLHCSQHHQAVALRLHMDNQSNVHRCPRTVALQWHPGHTAHASCLAASTCAPGEPARGRQVTRSLNVRCTQICSWLHSLYIAQGIVSDECLPAFQMVPFFLPFYKKIANSLQTVSMTRCFRKMRLKWNYVGYASDGGWLSLTQAMTRLPRRTLAHPRRPLESIRMTRSM